MGILGGEIAPLFLWDSPPCLDPLDPHDLGGVGVGFVKGVDPPHMEEGLK